MRDTSMKKRRHKGPRTFVKMTILGSKNCRKSDPKNGQKIVPSKDYFLGRFLRFSEVRARARARIASILGTKSGPQSTFSVTFLDQRVAVRFGANFRIFSGKCSERWKMQNMPHTL